MSEVLLPSHAGVPPALPAPALRRPAAARRPGDGVRLPPIGDRARRADHRPRREHPGHVLDDRARPVPPARRRRSVRHPRPRRGGQPRRPGRRDVRRADRRAGSDRASIFASPATRTRATSSPPPRHHRRRPIVGLRGRAPSPGQRPSAARSRRVASSPPTSAAPRSPVSRSPPATRCGAAPVRAPIVAVQSGGRRSAAVPPCRRDAGRLRNVSARRTPASRSCTTSTSTSSAVSVVALVGESGSGKTTLSRSIGGLHHEWTGEIEPQRHRCEPLARRSRGRAAVAIQYVFQNPYSSLNPRRLIGDSLAGPLVVAGASAAEADRAVGEMLERVSLTAGVCRPLPRPAVRGRAPARRHRPRLVAKPRCSCATR